MQVHSELQQSCKQVNPTNIRGPFRFIKETSIVKSLNLYSNDYVTSCCFADLFLESF